MKKTSFIFVVGIAALLITLYLSQEDYSENGSTKYSNEATFQKAKSKNLSIEYSSLSPTSITLMNSRELDTQHEYGENASSECVELSDKQIEIAMDQFDDFANEIVLTSSSVHEYFTTLQEGELIAEYEAGNKAAAYVLGMNYFYSSYDDSWFNPTLRSEIGPSSYKDTTLDKDKLGLARKWLWKAALDGISVALLELGSTYYHEKEFLERDYKNHLVPQTEEAIKLRISLLEVKAVAYLKLSEEVASDLYSVFGSQSHVFIKQFETLPLDSKEFIYEAINDQWVNDRLLKGEGKKIELEVPENIKEAISELQNSCND